MVQNTGYPEIRLGALEMLRPRPDVLVASVILFPFATVGLDFRVSLVVQAVGITVIVMFSLVELTKKQGRRSLVNAPQEVIVGTMMMVAAIFLGVVVGLVQGNSAIVVAGQVVSMGLLPAAVVGGLATWGGDCWESRWRRGLLWGVALGSLLQIFWCSFSFFFLERPLNLFLPNSTSVTGPALMALSFSVSSLADEDRGHRRLAWLAGFLVVVVILGSNLRSLWALAPLIIVVGVFFRARSRGRSMWFELGVVIVVGIVFVGCTWWLNAWTRKEREDVLRKSFCSLFPVEGTCSQGEIEIVLREEAPFLVDASVELPEAEAWRLNVQGHGEGKGNLVVALVFFDGHGRVLQRVAVPIEAGVKRESWIAVGSTPAGWVETRLRLSGWKNPMGEWHLEDIEISVLESSILARLSNAMQRVEKRFSDAVYALRTGRINRDVTLGFRWFESRRVLEEFENSSWNERIFGHGLGATVLLDIDGFDNRGHWIHYDRVNYLHNWYLFLLFKLGIVGTFLVLGSLVVWIFWTVRSARRVSYPTRRAFLTTATGVWIVYLVWSVTSPEILDFRMAPLWGWLVSASVSTVNEKKPAGSIGLESK